MTDTANVVYVERVPGESIEDANARIDTQVGAGNAVGVLACHINADAEPCHAGDDGAKPVYRVTTYTDVPAVEPGAKA